MSDISAARHDLDATLDEIARGYVHSVRSPLMRDPADAGLDFREVSFPSTDGTPLEAWFIPCPGSDELVICAHPMVFNRYGLAAHIEPWKSAFGVGYGNDVEVDFIPNYRILHDAGYNVLTFDFRNFGLSGAANGGLQSGNRFESRDVLGALAHVRRTPELAGMTVGIFAGCMGANATFRAIAAQPDAFADVRCLVAPLLGSPRAFLARQLEHAGLGPEYADEVDRRQRLQTSVSMTEASPTAWAPSVRVPTLTYGVRDDALIAPDELEAIYEAIGTEDKKLFWIHDTVARWDGYLHFQRDPEEVLAWLEKHMGRPG